MLKRVAIHEIHLINETLEVHLINIYLNKCSHSIILNLIKFTCIKRNEKQKIYQFDWYQCRQFKNIYLMMCIVQYRFCTFTNKYVALCTHIRLWQWIYWIGARAIAYRHSVIQSNQTGEPNERPFHVVLIVLADPLRWNMHMVTVDISI